LLKNILEHHAGLGIGLDPGQRRTVEIETQVRQGRAHSKILESADELAAEVIVMGTTGRSRLEATLLGSVAEKTMRLSSIPVLVVPTGSAMPVPRSHRALCPVDVSAEHSVEAARGAIRTAVQLGAEHVSLLHVFEVPLSLALMDHGTRRDEAIASLTARERARLASLQERCQELGARVEGAFVEGTVHDEISRRARTHGFEVIVMPTHGRGTVGQFLLGSVAAKVVRTSTVPVCTIRIQGLD